MTKPKHLSEDTPWRSFRRLKEKKQREAKGLTLAEGPEVVLTALFSSLAIDSLVMSQGFQDSSAREKIKTALRGREHIKIYVVEDDIFRRISQTKTPRGILAVMPYPFHGDLPKLDSSFTVALLDIQDPGNLGTIIRTAAATGAGEVLVLGESSDPFSPKSIRASSGAIFLIPTFRIKDVSPISTLVNQGVTIVKTYPSGGVPLWDLDLKDDICILLGNEGKGLGPLVQEIPGVEVTIPMTDRTESLNVAASSGMLMYEVLRQRSLGPN